MHQSVTKPADLAASNSLADLAHRIRAEHEAASADFNSGLRHALTAGELLLEAKDQLKHGQWLPWLREHCQVAERTAQAYMQVARGLKKLDADKSATVADLSFRDALRSLATTGRILSQLPAESYDRALATVADHDEAATWHQVARRVRLEDMRARNRGSLDTPRSMLPSPEGRKIRVARNPAERKWAGDRPQYQPRRTAREESGGVGIAGPAGAPGRTGRTARPRRRTRSRSQGIEERREGHCKPDRC